MKEFIRAEVLPFALVSLTIVGATVTLFGLPRDAPAKPAMAAFRQVDAAASRKMDDALMRAIAALRAARTQAEASLPPSTKPAGVVTSVVTARAVAPKPASAPKIAGAPMPIAVAGLEAAGATAPPETLPSAPMMSAVSSLTEAVKAIRSARTEEDFVRAEDQMRVVRTQLQAACTSGVSSAFCDSAREIGSLGF
jgi:hypothetical protein